ncbi:MafI family immunity protein [Hymenobacter sp. 5516J-16]|uniref:MafI family immunity protein n=1 Tax=Hymenobacter sp. 5516J-16 TaxID=2932253 RepID=UPI001FD465C0|nr:MafI family immunity protein [Hymenobacter sp. 5516J-16]UOQ77121.1 MafI family immunity protein [Hymenobacter sp. 5516J-16]
MWNWWEKYQREKLHEQLVTELLAASHEAGLPSRDYANAQDMLSVGEYGCAFDIIVQQLYEHEVEISPNLFALVDRVANSMLLNPECYFFLGELVRSPDNLCFLARKKLAILLSSLLSPR